MNDKEKSFKIKKIESYQKLENKARKLAVFDSFVTGAFAVSTVMGVLSYPNWPSDIQYVSLLMTAATTFCTVAWLKEAIQSICEKVMYKSKRLALSDELEYLDYEQNVDNGKTLKR